MGQASLENTDYCVSHPAGVEGPAVRLRVRSRGSTAPSGLKRMSLGQSLRYGVAQMGLIWEIPVNIVQIKSLEGVSL